MIQLPVSDATPQQFSTTINNRRATIRLRFNPTVERWFFDLALDGDFVLFGRKIVLNVDLIRQYGFGVGAIIAYSPSGDEPTRENLINGNVLLISATQDELDGAI